MELSASAVAAVSERVSVVAAAAVVEVVAVAAAWGLSW